MFSRWLSATPEHSACADVLREACTQCMVGFMQIICNLLWDVAFMKAF